MRTPEKILLHAGQIIFLAAVVATAYGCKHNATFNGDITRDYGLLGLFIGVYFVCAAIYITISPNK